MGSAWGAGLILLSAFLAATSQMLLKKSAMRQHPNRLAAYANPLVATAYAVLFSTALINMQAFVWLEYKHGAALSTASYAFVLFWSRLAFRETITRNKLAGMALIFAGIFLFLA